MKRNNLCYLCVYVCVYFMCIFNYFIEKINSHWKDKTLVAKIKENP